MSRTVEQKWNLLGSGQDSYSGQNSQDPRTSRRVQSWFPSDDGQLHRELGEPVYASNTVSGPIVGIYEFDQSNGQSAINRSYFCAARVNFTAGAKNCNFYQLVGGAWSQVTAVGTLADAPMCVTQENNFFLADGVSNWVFNGSIWVPDGINFPLNTVAINTSAGNAQVYLGTSGVQLQFFATGAPFNGTVSIATSGGGTVNSNNTVIAPSATVTATTGASLLFNPTTAQYNVSGSPINWATLNDSNGTITGYTNPWSGATTGYEMAASAEIVIPVPGQYLVTLTHDDGAFFGFGNGVNSGSAPTCSSAPVNVFQTLTAVNAYPVMAGTSKSANNGPWVETFLVNFTEADTYPLEIDYVNWEGQQTLQFIISQTGPTGGGPAPNPNPYFNGNSNPGNINAVVGRSYWHTAADQTAGVATESSSSPIGTSTGPLTGGTVKVYQQPGLFTSSTTSTTVSGSHSSDVPGPVSPDLNGTMVGQVLYINGTKIGTIAAVGGGNSLSLTSVTAPSGGDATYTGKITGGAGNALAGTEWTITGFANSGNNITNATVISSTSSTLVFANSGSVAEANPAAAATPVSYELVLVACSAPSELTLSSGSVVHLATYTGTITGGASNGLKGTIWTIAGFSNGSNNLTNAVVFASTATTLQFINANSVAETHAATATSAANAITLTANALASVSNGRAVIVDSRCTHWNVYASESDGSQIGQYLFSVPVTQNLSTNPYVDESPFIDNPANTFLPVFRPVRNDRAQPSKILTVHKVRQWRRVESSPNQFAFTANEEVTAGNNGDPAQCSPGANINTVSDMVNTTSFPDQSAWLRGLVPHMDALYMFSEKQCYPLYGQSVDDFAIAQNVAFALGLAGRFAAKSTPNGLIFVSYDKRVFLYPTSLYSTYLAQGGAAQSALVEIGKPLRAVLATIDQTRLDEVVTEYYHFGIRDWFVLCFPQVGGTYQTWVYDFMGKGWFQLQRGFASVAMIEVGEGSLVLVGGDPLGQAYVVDDQTGTYANTGALPAATWQPALIDFGNPDVAHVFQRLELEFDSKALAQATQITVWLDPLNVDSPGVGRKLVLKPALGANRYSASLASSGSPGATCQRMLVQVYVPSNTIAGVIRGIKLYANTAPGFLTGANVVGGA